jgi:hypothetical protein
MYHKQNGIWHEIRIQIGGHRSLLPTFWQKQSSSPFRLKLSMLLVFFELEYVSIIFKPYKLHAPYWATCCWIKANSFHFIVYVSFLDYCFSFTNTLRGFRRQKIVKVLVNDTYLVKLSRFLCIKYEVLRNKNKTKQFLFSINWIC